MGVTTRWSRLGSSGLCLLIAAATIATLSPGPGVGASSPVGDRTQVSETWAYGPTTNEVLGSGFQYGGNDGFFTIYASGNGNSATGSFSNYESGWPTSSTPATLRTANVTCVTYGSNDEATVTGTVTAGSNTETVVAQVQNGNQLRFSYAPTLTQGSPGCDTPALGPITIASGDIETGPPFTLSSGEVLASGQQAGSGSGLFSIDTQGTGNTASGNFTFYQRSWPTKTTPQTLRTAKVKCVLIDGPVAEITGKVKAGSDKETVVAEAQDASGPGGLALRFAFAGAYSKVSKGCDSTGLGPVGLASGDIEIGS